MGLSELRALVLEVNVATHGLPVTVTVPGEDAVECDGIWLTPDTVAPAGEEFPRREGRWTLVLRLVDAPSVPRETVVVGAPAGMASRRWVVDGVAKIEGDRLYVPLVKG